MNGLGRGNCKPEDAEESNHWAGKRQGLSITEIVVLSITEMVVPSTTEMVVLLGNKYQLRSYCLNRNARLSVGQCR